MKNLFIGTVNEFELVMQNTLKNEYFIGGLMGFCNLCMVKLGKWLLYSWNALLTSFLNGFCRIIACWKGLELKISNTLQDITIGKALQVIAYKIQRIDQKMR